MQDEKLKPLTELLLRLKKEMSSKALFDSTLVLAIIDFFEQEKIALEEIFDCLKTSFGGGFIEKLKQTILDANPQKRIRNVLKKGFFGQSTQTNPL